MKCVAKWCLSVADTGLIYSLCLCLCLVRVLRLGVRSVWPSGDGVLQTEDLVIVCVCVCVLLDYCNWV